MSKKISPVTFSFLILVGLLFFCAGIFFVGLYVIEIVIAYADSPDKSMYYWGSVVLFIGLILMFRIGFPLLRDSWILIKEQKEADNEH